MACDEITRSTPRQNMRRTSLKVICHYNVAGRVVKIGGLKYHSAAQEHIVMESNGKMAIEAVDRIPSYIKSN
jgi:hypothetical protein